MSTGRHSEGNKRGVTSIALVVALVAAVAGVGWVALRPDAGNSADDCDIDRPVVISVVPGMQMAMESALEEMKKDDVCFPAEIRTESPAAVEDSFFNGGRPDLWVADTPARVDRLVSIGINTTTLTPSLAVSPIGLVGGPNGKKPASWIAALESKAVSFGDPEVDSATAMALIAPVMESKTTKTSADRSQSAVVTAAQAYGVRAVEGNIDKTPLDEVGGTFTRLIPVTEQEMITRGNGNKNLQNLTPPTGSPALTFPLVKANGGAPDTDLVATKLRDWFSGQEGRLALAEAGLRPSDGSPLAGRGMESAKLLKDVPARQFNKVLGMFGVLSVPSSLLAVFDVSGSMDFPAEGGQTRVDLASGAAMTALEVFPAHARLGMWGFSIEQGGPGQDWRELAPMRRLNETTKGMSHKKYLQKQAMGLKNITQGGTGLYDTTLAAFKEAIDKYDRNYYNTVILLSDGANDDPGSISKAKLLAELAKLQDPERPVRIIGVGISEDADMPSLQQIAESTGGNAYPARDPRDILDVFAHAVMSR